MEAGIISCFIKVVDSCLGHWIDFINLISQFLVLFQLLLLDFADPTFSFL